MWRFWILFSACGFWLQASHGQSQASATSQDWGQLSNGEKVTLFTLQSGKIRAEIASYGAQIVSLTVPDREGISVNVVLGYPSAEAAEAGGTLGSVIGRFANRISGGGFEIDGRRYDLESVNPNTKIQIHGGKTGFQRQNWQVETDPGAAGFKQHPASVTLRHISQDGHEGFPGELTAWVQYRLWPGTDNTHSGSLEMEFRARTSQPTHVNLTNHAYFNLAGEGTLAGHRLKCLLDEVLESDGNLIPTGKKLPVESIGLKSGEFISLDPEEPDFKPLDHCLVTNPGQDIAVILQGGKGIEMQVETTQPGIQVYTANHFIGRPFPRYGAICFETQHFPDSPNRPGFPSTLLRPGEWLRETTVYRFRLTEDD